jgi:rhodanese-related sulfurtransferase
LHDKDDYPDPQSLRELVRTGEKVLIVDVRSPEEFAAGHVEGAINIPSDQLATQPGELPADARIVTVDRNSCSFLVIVEDTMRA